VAIVLASRGSTYGEQVLFADRPLLGSRLRLGKVLANPLVLKRHGENLVGVEPVELGHADHLDFGQGEQLFPAAQHVSQEVDVSVGIRRSEELAVDGQNGVQVVLRLDEAAEVRGHDPKDTGGGLLGAGGLLAEAGVDRFLRGLVGGTRGLDHVGP
jgi:hypothetical protein